LFCDLNKPDDDDDASSAMIAITGKYQVNKLSFNCDVIDILLLNHDNYK